MEEIGRSARAAAQELAGSTIDHRNQALRTVQQCITANLNRIIDANKQDLDAAKQNNLDGAIVKRLVLDQKKMNDLAQGITDVIHLSDPLGTVSLHRELTTDLVLQRITCPLGVLCIIFESRPEAVIQIASLAIKSGNAIILKGGKEAYHSNTILVECIREALRSLPSDYRIPTNSVQLVSTRDEIAELLKLDNYIDLVIPRGSNKLVRDIKNNTRIPVLGHADGICSIYMDKEASLLKSIPLIIDSKTQYPAACNATETLLVHPAWLTDSDFSLLGTAILKSGITVHCDKDTYPVFRACYEQIVTSSSSTNSSSSSSSSSGSTDATIGQVIEATEADYTMEWLSLHLTVVTISSVHQAVEWINHHGSHHTDCILTENGTTANYFTKNVDSAGVYVNASTRFADGFRYGFGAEIGISTNRLHARGPVGLEGLVTYKYVLKGNGQCVGQFTGSNASAQQSLAQEVNIGGQTLPVLQYSHRDLEP